MFKHELGKKAKDIITGFEGVIVCRCEYLTGCVQYGIKPTALSKDHLPIDTHWFDEDSIEVIGKGTTIKVNNDGGPQDSYPPS